MATEVVMPQMGESIAEGTITKWLVKVGDKVERDQPLFEISTDKVDAEIPSPADGVVLEIQAEEGATVPVNEVVARIGEPGEAGAAQRAPQETPEAQEGEEVEKVETETARETAAEAQPTPERTEETTEEKPEETAAEGAGEGADEDEASHMRLFASPVVKKIAEEESIDLSQVQGTGAHGRVTKQDVFAFLDERDKAPQETEASGPEGAEVEQVQAEAAEPEKTGTEEVEKEPAEKPWERPAAAQPAEPEEPIGEPAEAPAAAEVAAAATPSGASPKPGAGGFSIPAYTEGEEVEIEPMSKIRQITAAHMRYSKDTSAHVTTLFQFDFSRVARVRQAAKRGFEQANGTKLSYMPFVIKAVAAALKAHKKLNASIDGTNIVYKKHINIGIAVALDRGLIVPVLRDADRLSLTGIARTGNDLADRARSKKLGPDELQGGTFTITNPGVFGSLFGTPIINQPQVAILGLGAIEKRPVVIQDDEGNDAIAIRTMAYIPITYDHRLVDGADADHFMNDVKKMIEEDSWAELEPFM